MNSSARKRSFVVCFYCNETFRSLSSLLKHCCSAEENIALDLEPLESFSDTEDVDLSQENWESQETISGTNSNDLDHENSASSESVSEKLSDTVRPETIEEESNVSNVCENSLPGTESECEQPLSELSDSVRPETIEEESNVSNVFENSLLGTESECEQPLSETSSNATRQEITDMASDVPEKQLLDANTDAVREIIKISSDTYGKEVREVTELSFDVPEKQLLDVNTDAVREIIKISSDTYETEVREVTELSSDATEKQRLDVNTDAVREIIKISSDTYETEVREDTELSSDATEKQSSNAKEVNDLASDAAKKHALVANMDTEQKITEVEYKADYELNSASPDLALKVLQYYEKQTKQDDPDSYCKSPPTEVEFHSPLPAVESCFSRHDNTQMEYNATDLCPKGLSSEIKCDTNEENIVQKESDTLKQNAEGLESNGSNMCSRPSSPEVDSSGILSRSSSIEMDLDQAESSDSDVCNTLSLLGEKSNVLKHDRMQAELNAFKVTGKSVLEENLNITKFGSVVLKPCYVKVQDIFKSLSHSKLSPKKIFSWKKKYHVCDVCYKFFRLRSDLSIHYLTHTCDKPFMCNICGKSFVKQCNLFSHHLAHTIKRPHKCSVCKKAFPKKSILLRHKLIHTKEKPFACDKCGKTYSVKYSLVEHYLSHSGERPFICEICDASFHNKRYLRKHYRVHQKKENFSCEFCFKTFKRKHNLDEHYNIHVNDTPHECKICGKSFHLLLTLNKHYTIAHKDEKDLLFKESVKTPVDCKTRKDPFIQKIEIAPIVDKGEMTPIKKIEKSSVDHKSKETVPNSTRRKSLTPKKYLLPDSFVLD